MHIKIHFKYIVFLTEQMNKHVPNPLAALNEGQKINK